MARPMRLRTAAGTPAWRNAPWPRCSCVQDKRGEVMKRAAGALLALGLLQMTGDVFHLPKLKAIAAASAASPAPRVFSSVKGLETYSTQFFVEWTDTDGAFHSVQI